MTDVTGADRRELLLRGRSRPPGARAEGARVLTAGRPYHDIDGGQQLFA